MHWVFSVDFGLNWTHILLSIRRIDKMGRTGEKVGYIWYISWQGSRPFHSGETRVAGIGCLEAAEWHHFTIRWRPWFLSIAWWWLPFFFFKFFFSVFGSKRKTIHTFTTQVSSQFKGSRVVFSLFLMGVQRAKRVSCLLSQLNSTR